VSCFNTDFQVYADSVFSSARWRHLRARRLATEEQTDRESAAYEEREAENLRRESEAFLARQMEDMQALQDEQRKAGMLLDDGAPVKLNVSLAPAAPAKTTEPAAAAAKVVFTADEEEEEAARRRKVPLVKLDFSAAAGGEKALERLEKIKEMVPRDKETLFKAKVRWDGLSDASAAICLNCT
jgi:RNA-binding protein 25